MKLIEYIKSLFKKKEKKPEPIIEPIQPFWRSPDNQFTIWKNSFGYFLWHEKWEMASPTTLNYYRGWILKDCSWASTANIADIYCATSQEAYERYEKLQRRLLLKE